jgi:hypothetical protein
MVTVTLRLATHIDDLGKIFPIDLLLLLVSCIMFQRQQLYDTRIRIGNTNQWRVI